MQEPADYSRRILVAVTGLSPQILTETIYALTQQQKRPFVPTEVHLITTREGAKRAQLTLLSEEPGWFHRLRHDYGLPHIRFDENTIHTLRDHDGHVLDDICTPEDNQRAADTIISLLRDLTRTPGNEDADDTALHVSIAGGRKTMGYYAGYGLSLYGRPQDRLSHVLVSPPYESNRHFFYPTPYSHVIYTPPPESRPLDAREARVQLAEIPFVRLLEGLPEELRQGNRSFGQVIEAAQLALRPPRLTLHVKTRTLNAGGISFRMPPAPFALYLLLARRRASNRPGIRWTDAGIVEEYRSAYAETVGPAGGLMDRFDEAAGRTLGTDNSWIEQRKIKANDALRHELGSAGAKTYQVTLEGARAQQRYVLDPSIAPHAIRILE
ncbi:CRISPR-associated ring nuclease Csm6 [Ectothiorhodospira haloalkaliphila]|uniref:CRISPR-associated ring nuclease Csm6 n=1 Tax=Ectothiorhodospira haloalkaliphila TaxID=421628 RepID=UPI001EE786BB|nr:CRISPR-associated ring nuclease Csm6 [Ectothiorhodospira haloalkaliphila]MCG5525874.1 CRISPR-associated ring nuclease Csm6 [Ectothiorhodospira haloalkaliphila]